MSHKSWGSTVSDTDSVGGGSGLGSPTTSTGTTSILNSHMYYIKDILFIYLFIYTLINKINSMFRLV